MAVNYVSPHPRGVLSFNSRAQKVSDTSTINLTPKNEFKILVTRIKRIAKS